ncbi:MAG: ABC transporter permease, partial [Casimicrobiaceae bacterium]
ATLGTTVRNAPRAVPHSVSPGLWTLAWRRLKSDKVGMASLVIVVLYLVMVILSALGLIAQDWQKEVGVNYAPPSFLGPEKVVAEPGTASTGLAVPGGLTAPIGGAGGTAAGAGAAGHSAAPPYQSKIADPIGAVIAKLRAGKLPAGALPPETAEEKSVDPLAQVMAEIRADQATAKVTKHETRLATLPFGGDKWGRDVLKKTIKGSETSIFVGIAAATVATLIGTLLGALAGYYGRWVDDFLNWFYSVFSSMPGLLLILAVAAVLQHKGVFTIVLILGLTGWAGVFRLIRAEYLKHKAREYVQAADAIGASNARRMFIHIFPNASHVVLVQLSILAVAFIKAEVILSFLGFGVPVDVVSWGSMLNEAQNELILGKWWQLAAAGTAMAVLVTAFSIFTDSLRDALDPRLKGSAGA